MSQFPFSRDELYRVMQFFVDETEAAEVVDSLFQNTGAVQETAGHAQAGNSSVPLDPGDEVRERGPLRFESVSGITFTEDTLILLSMLSSDTEAKVDKYRHRHNPSRLTAEEERRWRERREELEGLPEVRGWRAKFRTN
jgi:hypothetical protein